MIIKSKEKKTNKKIYCRENFFFLFIFVYFEFLQYLKPWYIFKINTSEGNNIRFNIIYSGWFIEVAVWIEETIYYYILVIWIYG